MSATTYRQLFAYLGGLGFAESGRKGRRVWKHPASGIVLVFAPGTPGKAVHGADLLSVETRLQHHGLLQGSLQDAIQVVRAR